jgi:sporulation protein YlmC with PRC-barrel domain
MVVNYMEREFFKREELIGKLVINQEAMIVGKIKDLALIRNGNMGLLVKNEIEESVITLKNIKMIGDVILLKPKETEKELSSSPTAEIKVQKKKLITEELKKNICNNCGWKNKLKAKFCVKCGKNL